jgi:cytochrome d ubiquinol oxidase subunit I
LVTAIGGWMVREVGRQPWVVYGLQRTMHADSTNVTPAMTYFTLFGFMGLYLLVGLLYLLLFLRIVAAGPGGARDEAPLGTIGSGAAVAGGRS